MADDILRLPGPWLPGSFTKNFRWGKDGHLKSLYDDINAGFNGKLEPVTREEYRNRVKGSGRPELIPVNFFLFNKVVDGRNYLLVDELVFQAIKAPHSPRFDLLAIFAFNFSHAGHWKGQRKGQRYPAVWATDYVVNRVNGDFAWDAKRVTADDIEQYLHDQPKFKAQTAHEKVGTNLSFFYESGGLKNFSRPRIERWWVDALFLALDRAIEDRKLDGMSSSRDIYSTILLNKHFLELTGPTSLEKSYAIGHLLSLYSICGGIKRFDADQVEELVTIQLPDYVATKANDDRPQGAMHPTNRRILKTIPRECAELAKLAGFSIIMHDDLEAVGSNTFIKQAASDALSSLSADGYSPIMTAEELHKLTRGE